jgi:hypothetical protein
MSARARAVIRANPDADDHDTRSREGVPRVTISSRDAGGVAPPTKPPVGAAVYAVIHFDGSERRVAEVVVAFEDALAADRYATENGLVDYTVAPIGFHLGERPCR